MVETDQKQCSGSPPAVSSSAPPLVREVSSRLRSSQGLEVVYRNLSYSVPVKKEKKTTMKPIIRGVSGVFRPNRFTAIMGPSGSGKTTLLNLIAGLASTKGEITGDILVNGQKLSSDVMRSYSALVHQEDVILETLTVREALTLSARLRLPSSLTVAEQLDRVQQVINMLHLNRCSESRIGSIAKKGISGGERRRVSLGLELITNPPILLLDECTSGLDTFTAFEVVQLLSSVAHNGRTVVATIHAPSSDMFKLFDDLVLILDGEIAFHGPVSDVVEYFSKLGYQCPVYVNPADFIFMSVLNKDTFDPEENGALLSDVNVDSAKKQQTKREQGQGERGGGSGADGGDGAEGALIKSKSSAQQHEETEKVRLDGLISGWRTSPLSNQLDGMISQPSSDPLPPQTQGSAPYWTQFFLLSVRSMNHQFRHAMLFRAKFGQTVFLALVLGLVYLNLSTDQRSIQDRVGCLFILVVQAVFGSISGFITAFGNEHAVLHREIQSGMYHVSAYFWSRNFIEIPFRFFFPIVSACIIYWMIGLQNTPGKFFIYVAVNIMLEHCGAAFGLFIGCLFPDINVAVALVPLILMPLLVFSGVYINLNSIPVYFRWLSYLSPMKWGFVGIIQNELSGLQFNCDDAGDAECLTTGEEKLTLLGMDDQPSIVGSIWILFGLGLGFMGLGLVALQNSTTGLGFWFRQTFRKKNPEQM